MDSHNLISELIKITLDNKKSIKQFKVESTKSLNYKSTPKSWSVLECIAHLNRYGEFYIPEINQVISNSTNESAKVFKTGFLGDYFAKSMMPKDKLNVMKTFKGMNPNNEKLLYAVLDKAIEQQESIIKILKRAQNVDLTKNKTSISISKLIKLRLGDTLRVVIYHNQRHIIQAQKCLEQKQVLVTT